MSGISNRTSGHCRYETLDGMRGIAAFCVMIFHYTASNRHLLASSATAVDLFFMLSGFVIAHSYGSRLQTGMTTLEYLAKRFIRLYPMYLLGLAVGAAVLFLMQQSGRTSMTPTSIVFSLLLNVFYLPYFNNFGSYSFDGAGPTVGFIFPTDPPAWSLSCEIVASISFLVFFNWSRSALVKLVAGSFLAYLAIGLCLGHHSFNADIGWNSMSCLGGFPRVIYGFCTGLILYSIANDEKFQKSRTFIQRYIKSSYLLYVVLVLVLAFGPQFRGLYPIFVLLIAAPFLVYAGSVVTCSSGASLPIARFLGMISYPMYCLHHPIGRAVFLEAHRAHYSSHVAVIVSICLTVIASVVLTKAIDEPVRDHLSQKLFLYLKKVKEQKALSGLSSAKHLTA